MDENLVYLLEKDVLGKLLINRERMPLSDKNRLHMVTWLRQMANQYEKGELFSSVIMECRIPEGK